LNHRFGSRGGTEGDPEKVRVHRYRYSEQGQQRRDHQELELRRRRREDGLFSLHQGDKAGTIAINDGLAARTSTFQLHLGKMLEIDGSHGEGGGQILRTALGLSCLLQKPFRIFNIRKSRRKPGLMPQHLACVRALARVSNAAVKGDHEGSVEIIFEPGEPGPGDFFFDIGTAGSTSLLFQAVLPSLIRVGGDSRITLKGGTHVPFSPPFQYISDVFVPALEKLGIRIKAEALRCGFYPRGGGEVRIKIARSQGIRGMTLRERARTGSVSGISGVGNLPVSIAERQRKAAVSLLLQHGLGAEIDLLEVPAFGKGTFLFLLFESENCVAGFSALGELGKKAETVGEEAARELIDYYRTSACLDPHLADQIVPYLAAAQERSSFTTSRISGHLLTNLWITEKFAGVKYAVEGERGKPGKVSVNPLS
jgi:RNA 3'-terminal phosphate cyclase (ATP)